MIWQFGELAYDFSINRCEDGTISDQCRLANKPVRWDYWTASAPRQQLYYQTAALAHLKTETVAIHKPSSHDYITTGKVKRLRTFHSDLNMVVLGNVDPTLQFGKADFPHDGVWYDYMSNDSIVVSNTAELLTLEPGEVRVYLDKRVANPFAEELGLTLANLPACTSSNWILFPNPTQGLLQVSGDGIQFIRLVDVQGRIVLEQAIQDMEFIDVSIVKPGLYTAVISGRDERTQSQWLSVQP
jgi:hypothetical protein